MCSYASHHGREFYQKKDPIMFYNPSTTVNTPCSAKHHQPHSPSTRQTTRPRFFPLQTPPTPTSHHHHPSSPQPRRRWTTSSPPPRLRLPPAPPPPPLAHNTPPTSRTSAPRTAPRATVTASPLPRSSTSSPGSTRATLSARCSGCASVGYWVCWRGCLLR